MSSRKTQNLPQLWRHPQKIQAENLNFLKNLSYKTSQIRRGFEKLSSSICR